MNIFHLCVNFNIFYPCSAMIQAIDSYILHIIFLIDILF